MKIITAEVNSVAHVSMWCEFTASPDRQMAPFIYRRLRSECRDKPPRCCKFSLETTKKQQQLPISLLFNLWSIICSVIFYSRVLCIGNKKNSIVGTMQFFRYRNLIYLIVVSFPHQMKDLRNDASFASPGNISPFTAINSYWSEKLISLCRNC